MLAGACPHAVGAASAITKNRDGTVEIAGRKLQCGNVRSTLDRRLPNLGISIPDIRLLVLNPVLLQRFPQVVRLFVYNHECGHHHVGASELRADCWAVGQGVREGWLDKQGLAQVCRSFGNAPKTPTHPSGAVRCRNLERCFASATSTFAQASHGVSPGVGPGATPVSDGPRLVAGPKLLREGSRR